jgi:N-acetylglucosaminyl-diphospho-decaprenol L-rhamnosyltransferase
MTAPQVLPACLDALAGEGVPALVIDNASSDDSREVAQAHGATVIANRAMRAMAAPTISASAATTPYVLIVNPDLELQSGALPRCWRPPSAIPMPACWRRASSSPPAASSCSRARCSRRRISTAGDMPIPTGDACLPFLSGACLLIRRETFLALGGFDPAIFLFYEDDDLCRRMRDAGHSLVHVDAAEARHAAGPLQPTLAAAPLHCALASRLVGTLCRQKYGLPVQNTVPMIANGLKAIGYGLVLNRTKMFAHAGSCAGAWAFVQGQSALKRQGLEGAG